MASRVNRLYETGKQVAGLFVPAMDRLAPGMAQGMVHGIGAMDRLRDKAVDLPHSMHNAIQDKIRENSDILQTVRAAKPIV